MSIYFIVFSSVALFLNTSIVMALFLNTTVGWSQF